MDTSARTHASWSHDGLSHVTTALAWTLIVLMIVPEGFDYSLLLVGRAPQAGDLISRLLWVGLLVGSSAVVLLRGALAWQLLRHLNPFLIAFVALALASVMWSADPMLTVRRDIRLLTIVLVAVAFAVAGWHPRRLQGTVRPILTVMLLGSLIFGIVSPSLGIHQETAPELLGAWRGLTNHKNSLGALSGVTLLFWLHARSTREVHTLPALLGGLLAATCLWLSRSATSLIATVFAMAFLGLVSTWPRNLQPYLKYAIALVTIAVTIYALAMLHLIPGQRILLAPITMVTGFDTTFTGRSEIWNIVTDQISLHPLFGIGYGAYWGGPTPQSPSYEFIVKMNGFYPGTAHNGYLEIANDMGWTGLLLLFGFMTIYLRQALRLFAIDAPQARLFLMLFMHQAIANLSESHWLSVLSVHFVFMMLATAVLARHLLEYLRWRAYEARYRRHYQSQQPVPSQQPAAAASS